MMAEEAERGRGEVEAGVNIAVDQSCIRSNSSSSTSFEPDDDDDDDNHDHDDDDHDPIPTLAPFLTLHSPVNAFKALLRSGSSRG